MNTIQITTTLCSVLLVSIVNQTVLAEPNYPEDFTPQIIYQDKEYIAQHSDSDQSSTITAAASSGPCSCPCGSSPGTPQPDITVPGDFEPVILYQDKEYISKH